MKHLCLCVLFLACAAHAGAAEPTVVSRGAPDALQPQAAVDEQGQVHVVFGSGDSLFYCRSGDGRDFSEPVELPTGGKLALGMRRGPRIAVAAGTIVIAAIVGQQGGGRDGDILAWRSQDGASWAGPARVNDAAGAAREGLHALAAGPDGRCYCAWLDLRNGKTEIFCAASDDQGTSWGENRRVYRAPGGSVCECCHPSVVVDAQGKLYVMWRNSVDGQRDMYWSISRDGGATFSRAKKLGRGGWPLDACPMDGGAIVVDGTGEAFTLWRREGEIFAAGPRDADERRLGRGEQPWAAPAARGAYCVWLAGRPGDLLFLPPGAQRPRTLAQAANDPVVVAGSAPGAPAVVLWETGDNGHREVRALVVPPNE